MAAFFLVTWGSRYYLTADTISPQIPWWNYLLAHGWHGIATLNADIHGDYTTIWYFVIECFIKIGLYPRFPIEFNLKLLAIITTFLSAGAVFAITRHFRPKSKNLPFIAAAVTLFLPTFFMDLLKTNLTDGMYIAPMLWSFYFFIKKRRGTAWFLLGFGACFKLMAIYLAPVYILVYLRDFARNSWRERIAPIFAVLAMLLCSLPNMLAGGKFFDGFFSTIFSRGDGGGPCLFLIPWGNNLTGPNAPKELKFVVFGLLLFALFMIGFFVLRYIKIKSAQDRVIFAVLPTLSILLCYMLMPAQHGNYLAAAGVFALVGFIIILKREFFANFIAVNAIIYILYLQQLTWWISAQILVFPIEQIAMIAWAIIGWNLYLIFRESEFYHPKIREKC